jgi:hypothetical protein
VVQAGTANARIWGVEICAGENPCRIRVAQRVHAATPLSVRSGIY